MHESDRKKLKDEQTKIYYASVSWSSIVCCISSGLRRSIANFFFADAVCESFLSSCCSISFTRFEYSWNDAANAYVNFLASALLNMVSIENKNQSQYQAIY